MDKIIINYTPTGMIPTKEQTPHVPVTPPEIIKDVVAASKLGITMVHLHIRDESTGKPCYKKETYARVISGIREQVSDLVICVSTSGRNIHEFEKRSDVLSLEGDLKPDMASLTLSSLNFNNQASINEPDMIMALAGRMLEKGIKPELEVFDVGMINYAGYLRKKEKIRPPYYFNLILGNIACAQANLLHAGIMVDSLPDEALFSLGGVGDYQLPVNSLAISMGYGVRVGLEDNIWFNRKKQVLATNTQLIDRIHTIIDANGKTAMTPEELREKLSLKNGRTGFGF